MKTLARVASATLFGSLMLVAGAARLVAFLLTGGSAPNEPQRDEPGAGPFGRDDVSRADLGAFGRGDMPGDGYTIHGREPITVGRNGERVGAYSGDPIIHL